MIESILEYISSLSPFWIYVLLFCFAYLENVFPPSPSDLVVVIGGSLVAKESLNFFLVLLLTSLGSVLGFMTLYYIGSQLDKRVIRAGKIKFISLEALDKTERWFNKYGYVIILANRFLPGTRSVISFFSGLSELKVSKTALLASVSALVWNSIIIYLGIVFGNNISRVDYYLARYQEVVLIATGAVIVIFLVYHFFFKKRTKPGNAENTKENPPHT